MPTEFNNRSAEDLARIRARDLRYKAKKAAAWGKMCAAFAAKRKAPLVIS